MIPFGKGLVTNYREGGGGYKMGRGGACEVLPLRKGRGGKSLSHTEGGGRAKFPLFKRGWREKFYPVLRGGGRKKFWTRDFPIL